MKRIMTLESETQRRKCRNTKRVGDREGKKKEKRNFEKEGGLDTCQMDSEKGVDV